VVAGVDATIAANFATVLAVPTTNFLGGTLMIGGTLPVGAPILGVDAILTGPLGNRFSVSRHDSDIIVGDPVMNAALGWKSGNMHIQASTMVNIPVGTYRENQLANIAFHRWAVDGSLAVSWNDPKIGWDISGKTGVTMNGRNDVTDYDTGTEFHLEGSVEKTFSPKFSAGVQGYYFKQLTADTGSGAKLGPFEGEVIGLGISASAHVMLGRSPSTVRAQVFKEFDATNRLEGESLMLTLSLPLNMKMPPGAAP
jgi:hypothetical protein